MKIIFVNRFFFPDHAATSQMVSALAFHLASRGWEVAVVASRLRYEDAAPAYPPRERIAGVDVVRVRTSRFGRFALPGRAVDYLTFYLSTAWQLAWLARPGDVIVAKTDAPLISVVAGGVARLRGAQLVNWLQDLFPEVAAALGIRPAKGAPGSVLAGLRNRSLAAAAMNVAIGDGMRKRLIDLGVDDGRACVVHNWADDERIRPLPAESSPLREEWGLNGKLVVGYSGNLGRAHEYETLLSAADLLREQDDVAFLFIGGGAAMNQLREQAAARGLGNVMFQPYQPTERLGESLAVSDVHLVVLLPEMEGLIVPSKFYGIAAAGRPTIFVGSVEGEIAGLLSASEAGVAVARWDGDGLAAEILALRDDPELRQRMGRNARRLCEERFSRRGAMEQWEQVLTAAGALREATPCPRSQPLAALPPANSKVKP